MFTARDLIYSQAQHRRLCRPLMGVTALISLLSPVHDDGEQREHGDRYTYPVAMPQAYSFGIAGGSNRVLSLIGGAPPGLSRSNWPGGAVASLDFNPFNGASAARLSRSFW